jgi:hypothetical protein
MEVHVKKIKSILLFVLLSAVSLAPAIDVAQVHPATLTTSAPALDRDGKMLQATSDLLQGTGENVLGVARFLWKHGCEGGRHVYATVGDSSSKLLADKSGMSILGLVSLWSLPVIAAGVDFGINGRGLVETDSTTNVTTNQPAGTTAVQTHTTQVRERGQYMSPGKFLMEKRLKLYACTAVSALVCCGKFGGRDLKGAAGFAAGAVAPAVANWLWNRRSWRFQWPIRPA